MGGLIIGVLDENVKGALRYLLFKIDKVLGGRVRDKEEAMKRYFLAYQRYSADRFGEYSGSDDMKFAFQPRNRTVCCIDGRVSGGNRIAGGGILLAYKYGEEYALNVISRMNPDGIYSHENCGAARMVAEARGIDPADGDQLGIKWAKRLSSKLGIPHNGHLSVDCSFHPEMGIFLDGTGRFDPACASKGIPGFGINAKYVPVPIVQEEMRIAIEIAFGPTGLGERFTREFPFLIVGIGDPRDSCRSTEALEAIVHAALGASYGDRVRMVSFTPPKEWLTD